jgi:hypothetical protein
VSSISALFLGPCACGATNVKPAPQGLYARAEEADRGRERVWRGCREGQRIGPEEYKP